MCGFIGKESTLTGIIALDASTTIFETNSESGRLSKTDADVVFVVHTDVNLIGFKKPIGDVDFYVNGREKQTLQCGPCYICLVPLNSELSCDHMVGYDMFIEKQYDCATNVFCPLRNYSAPVATIDGIKFPETDPEKQIVIYWVPVDFEEPEGYRKRVCSMPVCLRTNFTQNIGLCVKVIWISIACSVLFYFPECVHLS